MTRSASIRFSLRLMFGDRQYRIDARTGAIHVREAGAWRLFGYTDDPETLHRLGI